MKNYEHFGVMIDMSRNAVMSVDGLLRFLPLLAKMGYNCCMLYTEDTYEVDGEPTFGYLRGRYGKEELQKIDRAAAALGIELIPCIQTLAHLNATFRWGNVPCDTGDILLADDGRTYEFIDRMFSSLADSFTSRLVHIGMDEAHMLGRGKHLDLHGYEPAGDIMKRHLARVAEIAKKHGFSPMLWSDMFFRPWNGGGYYIGKTDLPQEVLDELPDGVIPVYWDYYHDKEASYDAMMYNHRQFTDDFWFAGGVWTWTGFAPHNRVTLGYMLPALDACEKNNVRNVIFTMWGDNGGECSRFAALPALFYLAEYAKGERDGRKIKENFKTVFGVSYDDFAALDLPNLLTDKPTDFVNPSKYMLYSDVFNGFLDPTADKAKAERYPGYAARLREVAKKTKEYGYLFDTMAALSDVLSLKYALGIRTRAAYEAGDRAALTALLSDYDETVRRLSRFHRALEKQWFLENKPSGFDIQDLRLGGLEKRLRSCRRRIADYLRGKITRIDELEEPLLPYGKTAPGTDLRFNNFGRNASCNVT